MCGVFARRGARADFSDMRLDIELDIDTFMYDKARNGQPSLLMLPMSFLDPVGAMGPLVHYSCPGQEGLDLEGDITPGSADLNRVSPINPLRCIISVCKPYGTSREADYWHYNPSH